MTYFVQDNLWGKVVRCAAEGVCSLGSRNQLAESKICDLDVALVVQQDIFWLHSTNRVSKAGVWLCWCLCRFC